MLVAARIVNAVILVIVGLILVGMVLYIMGADVGNPVVGFLVAAGAFLVGPFATIFVLADNNVEIALNWGIAMLVYLGVGILITKLLERAGDRRVGAKG